MQSSEVQDDCLTHGLFSARLQQIGVNIGRVVPEELPRRFQVLALGLAVVSRELGQLHGVGQATLRDDLGEPRLADPALADNEQL